MAKDIFGPVLRICIGYAALFTFDDEVVNGRGRPRDVQPRGGLRSTVETAKAVVARGILPAKRCASSTKHMKFGNS